MKISKTILVWIGILCLNLRLKLGVRVVSWLFSLSPTLRAA